MRSLNLEPDERDFVASIRHIAVGKRTASRKGHALGVMTLGFERIWITAEEVSQVAAAIQSTGSPSTLR